MRLKTPMRLPQLGHECATSRIDLLQKGIKQHPQMPPTTQIPALLIHVNLQSRNSATIGRGIKKGALSNHELRFCHHRLATVWAHDALGQLVERELAAERHAAMRVGRRDRLLGMRLLVN